VREEKREIFSFNNSCMFIIYVESKCMDRERRGEVRALFALHFTESKIEQQQQQQQQREASTRATFVSSALAGTAQPITSIIGKELFVCKENYQKHCIGKGKSYSVTIRERENGKFNQYPRISNRRENENFLHACRKW
jgi:hypothetical protein